MEKGAAGANRQPFLLGRFLAGNQAGRLRAKLRFSSR
jgi:hypothetical protein